MLFDESLGKGVRKRYIPASQTITFSANATYDLVIQKSQEIFFPDEAREQEDLFCLADSSGIPYEIGNKCEWKLSEFVQGLKLPPSKLRLYVMYRPKDPTVSRFHVPIYYHYLIECRICLMTTRMIQTILGNVRKTENPCNLLLSFIRHQQANKVASYI